MAPSAHTHQVDTSSARSADRQTPTGTATTMVARPIGHGAPVVPSGTTERTCTASRSTARATTTAASRRRASTTNARRTTCSVVPRRVTSSDYPDSERVDHQPRHLLGISQKIICIPGDFLYTKKPPNQGRFFSG
ncbi:MAG: hypothetical protein CO030_01110 [Candidatus Magasanikbacteria bacterium CG_4_9_14_0_2_um_filter_42_11]|uniref:Uncharacterized protein n=1 Tax=Candidatus Magasanikbacteria bacterium CG_4_9_14_0_2_um_filter_42_11 TaxID=1974643 RepID=A0A2M8FAL7_9BACT|nr:MAG: hypothetical protein COY70_03015 [Candidatus Magasanikbacteria bacterium CG_4_10_14_0_8_um_filter_42_12]PJC52780.1 MAG: hypothetical protein CO030_01110 [Candidatus Magasanikbacteria bacterium CG_4_9_14_0_2_um_filter_42_11]